MNRHFLYSPLALAALALGGCVQDKPAPRLESPDRGERIEAVRAAQDRYGARPRAELPENPQPVQTIPVTLPPELLADSGLAKGTDALVGRWNPGGDKSAYFQFNTDGTFRDESPLNTTTGRWRFVSADTIELYALEYNLLFFWAPRRTTLEYRFVGDCLWLKGIYTSNYWVGCIRAADKEKRP